MEKVLVSMSSDVKIERASAAAAALSLDAARAKRHVHFSRATHVDADGEERDLSSIAMDLIQPSYDPDFRPKRKRSCSFTHWNEYRYWSSKRRKPGSLLPSQFLLGGTITDPLNLGSLDEEDDNSNSKAELCKSPEDPTCSEPVEVIIPVNINDPLNLNGPSESLIDMIKRQRRRRRARKRKRRNSDSCLAIGHGDECMLCGNDGGNDSYCQTDGVADGGSSLANDSSSNKKQRTNSADVIALAEKEPATRLGTTKSPYPWFNIQRQRSKNDNKIVSPVVIYPSRDRRRYGSHRSSQDDSRPEQLNLQPPAKFNPKNEQFQYGNYNKYYGYRNPDQLIDPRLEYLRAEWFQGKEVLDIGCNIGHITLTIGRDYKPSKIIGIDIDKKLVNIAKKNIKHYLCRGVNEEVPFPKSMGQLYGSLKPPVCLQGEKEFPYNVKFYQSNYVPESELLLETVQPEFDVILCLSVTKWVHLNWGDSGLKLFFKRIYRNLRKGGKLILEPQSWASYTKKKKLTSTIFENYKSITLFPGKFKDYLLHEVGFTTCEQLATPYHVSIGFQRPVFVYTKEVNSTSEGATKSSAESANPSFAAKGDPVHNINDESCNELDSSPATTNDAGSTIGNLNIVKDLVGGEGVIEMRAKASCKGKLPLRKDCIQKYPSLSRLKSPEGVESELEIFQGSSESSRVSAKGEASPRMSPGHRLVLGNS